MSVSILSTKFYVPPARENAVPRPFLVQKLLTGMGRKGSFTLVSGPAGFGKTTLLSEFVSRTPQGAAWVSLDEGDNDPIQFWTYLVTACRSMHEDVGDSALEVLNTQQTLPGETVPTLLINDLAAGNHSLVLVLDDYHSIELPSIHSSMRFLLEHLPHNLHVVVSTRLDPPWPLARFRASNRLTEIRVHDLRFSTQEAGEFLNRTMGLNLSLQDVAALEERTEGWAAGLQLAALSMQGRSDAPAFVKAFTGSNLYVADYLVEEVLQRQPDSIRSFLLQTSILSQMNAALCEAVTKTQDGQAILQSLLHTNTFLVALDNQGNWFRYHHLFADLLQSRLKGTYPGEEISALHLRAAEWFEGQRFYVEAVQHAFASRNFEKAASLVDRYGQEMFFSEQYAVLRNWLEAVPGDYFQAYPRLEIYRLLIDLLQGTLDMYEQTLIEKENLIKALPPTPENARLRRRALVHLSLFYAFQNTTKAIQIAEEALAETPDSDMYMQAFIYSSFYRGYGMEGNIEKSAAAYRESFRLAEITGQYEMISNSTKIRTFDLCQYGRLDEAAEYCQRIIDAGARRKSKVFYPAGPCYVGLGGIQLERNELEKASENISRGLEMCQQGAMYGLFTGYVQMMRLLQAQGKIDEALEELQLIEQNFQRREFTFMAQKVSLLLAAGDLAGASALVPGLLEILGVSHYAQQLPLIAAEAFKLSLARIYIAQGEVEKAKQLLDEIQVTVEPGQRYGRLMEVYLLRALALYRQGDEAVSPAVIEDMEKALDLAVDPGFMMLFLEEGQTLVPLLYAVVNHKSAGERVKRHARRLLQDFAGMGKTSPAQAVIITDELVEQLTPREMEVLLLMATGDSNQEIAEKLVITVRTVKKHTSNIYGKLNVSSRIQAVARARELGLLAAD